MDSSTQLDERTGLLRNEAEARRQLLEDAFDISSVGILRARNVYRTKPPRIVALDVFRGFMMLLQSVEHARIFLTKSKSQAQMEIWYSQPAYKNSFDTLIRIASHLAPLGFAFVMGIGIVLFSQSRIMMGWSLRSLAVHFLIRGLVLVALNFWFALFFMLAFEDNMYHMATVLFALGINFTISGFIFLISVLLYYLCMRFFEKRADDIEVVSRLTKSFRIFILISLSILLSIGVVLQTPKAITFVTESLWRHILVLPGVYKSYIFIHPPLDWLSLVIYGVAFALLTSRHVTDTSYNIRLNLKAVLILFVLFLLIRIPGKFGNINPELLPLPPKTLFHNPYLANWMQFFNVVIYPPDLAYITFYMGLNHLLLSFLYSLSSSPTSLFSDSLATSFVTIVVISPLLCFGQSALLFYIVHLKVYWLMKLCLVYVFGSKLYHLGDFMFWFLWCIGLGIMWVCCSKFARYKARKGADSLWRFF
ncbi:succinyl-coa synthetase-like protein [Gigaspora margarita]|uniref:Succinyl-coa synthetase-like protein n=1 Tax=Gigaspora margarita TaxID=4874 RepID=A0A8H4AC96_GIGMA|nr:succinyl-coa synthetase-like protein [Gigaspora margarita]